MIIQEALLH